MCSFRFYNVAIVVSLVFIDGGSKTSKIKTTNVEINDEAAEIGLKDVT